MHGYREVFSRSGFWFGNHMPPHARFYMRLAPLEWPGAVMVFKMNDGSPDSYIGPEQISSIEATSDGATFFGFGLAGMAAAGIASRLDSLLAPWELTIEGPPGTLQFYAPHGPPPSAEEWARVEARFAAAGAGPSSSEWESDLWEEEASDDEQVSEEEERDGSLSMLLQDIFYEYRIGSYQLSDVERGQVMDLLSYMCEDLVEIYRDDVDSLRAPAMLFGFASQGEWYGYDPESAELVEAIVAITQDSLQVLAS